MWLTWCLPAPPNSDVDVRSPNNTECDHLGKMVTADVVSEGEVVLEHNRPETDMTGVLIRGECGHGENVM